MTPHVQIVKAADIDPTGQYRYSLTRIWRRAHPRVCFIMLNPSTADAHVDDPTIRRCLGFAQRWGFGGLEVVNLFAFRSSSPEVLQSVEDPVGPDNERYLKAAAARAGKIVLAFGASRLAACRWRAVEPLFAGLPLYCLGECANGAPRHPLYVSSSVSPMLWRVVR